MAYRIPVLKVSLVRESTASTEYRRLESPFAAAEVLRGYLADADREHCVALLLDTRNRLIGLHTISVGTLNSSMVHPRETFKAAILLGAAGIILGHNHPSGDPDPSQEDKTLTWRMKEAGQLLGIPVLDHVIIGDEQRFASLTQLNLL